MDGAQVLYEAVVSKDFRQLRCGYAKGSFVESSMEPGLSLPLKNKISELAGRNDNLKKNYVRDFKLNGASIGSVCRMIS